MPAWLSASHERNQSRKTDFCGRSCAGTAYAERVIQELDEEDKQTIFKMIETFLTKKKFKDFFNKNVAAL